MTQPSNPVCPACGEAVGATSTYCHHCDADFDAPTTRPPGSDDRGDDPTGIASENVTPDAIDDYGTTGDGYDGDHPLDGAARVVGLALAACVGLAATITVVLAFAQQPSIWLPLGLAALAGTIGLGVHVWRFPTGRGAHSRSLYLTASGLVVIPVAFGLFADTESTVGEALVFAAIFGAIGLVFAIPTVLVSYWLDPDRV